MSRRTYPLRNYPKTVTLSEAKGLACQKERFFAALRMTLCVSREFLIRRCIAFSIFLLLLTAPAITTAKTIYVDDDGPADFNNIQAAINDANEGDKVFVAPGTYNESVFMKEGVNLQGAGAENTIIDYRFVSTGGVVIGANNCRLDGFTITDSEGEDTDGVYCEDVENFTISHNIIKNNSWSGIGLYNSSPIITNNIISNNIGAGIWCRNGSSPIIINNVITGNRDEAGINSWSNSSPIVINNIITNNTGYGGIFCEEGTATILYNNVWKNSSKMYGPIDYVGCEPRASNISADPCFAKPGYRYDNETPDKPWDDFWIDGDYHLKSQAGRWDANEGRWTKDDVTSPCIDAGDPASPIGLEPFPNGGIINMGDYGGTAEASKSYFGEPVCETIVAGDINGDCIVNLKDFAIMAFHWLEEQQ